MDKHSLNIIPVGDSLLVPSKKLWRWEHDNLSGFLSASAVKERHQHDFVVKTKDGKSKTIRVPILEVDNLGTDMAIDEKQIGGDFLGDYIQFYTKIHVNSHSHTKILQFP